MLKIVIHPAADKYILKIPKKTRLRVLEKIMELEPLNHPLQHPHVIKLEGGKEERFRLRVGEYRIKFVLRKPNIIAVNAIDSRQAGY